MDHDIDPFSQSFILKRARQISEAARRANLDQEDVVSELTLRLLRVRERFDPERGCWTTYVKVVVINSSRDLLRQWDRENTTVTLSLSDPGVRLAAFQVEETEALRKHHLTKRPEHEHSDLVSDVTIAVDQLPVRDQQLCEALSRSSTTDAAKAVGHARSHVYQRIDNIRKRFIECELDEYQ